MSTEYTVDTPYTSGIKQELLFAWIYILFIFSWISIDVVGRALNNFTFRTLGLDENSTWHTTIIAFVVIFLELLTIYYLKSSGAPIYGADCNDSPSTSNPQFDSIIDTSYHPYLYKGTNNYVAENTAPCNLNAISNISNISFI